MGVESYAHRAAKSIVCGWLRGAARLAGDNSHTRSPILGIAWRVNRGAPFFGVWEEYPVLRDGTGILPVWDECWDDPDDRPPTYEQLKAARKTPVAIFDVVVQHKGQIAFAVEIMHKHALTPEKLSFLRGLEDRPLVLALPTAWVLRQVGVPTALPAADWWHFGRPNAYQASEAPFR